MSSLERNDNLQSPTDPVIPKEKLVLLPYYHELVNELKQPDRVRIQTDYFWRRWSPKLGPTLTVLVVALRSYCYYNKLTKEKRDWCFPEQRTLAANLGVSVDTVQRELKKPIAKYFVRREARYRYEPVTRRKVRTADMYYVAMDDPLSPEDEALLASRAAKRLSPEGDSPKPQNAVYEDSSVDNSPSAPQSAAQQATAKGESVTSTLKRDFRTFSRDIHRELTAQQETLVSEILTVCGDEHSRRFYKSVVRVTTPQAVWRALAEVKDAARTGRLKKTKGAYFTNLILREISSLRSEHPYSWGTNRRKDDGEEVTVLA